MIERVSRNQIYSGIINVNLDTVLLPNGEEHEFTLLEYPKSVGVVPMLADQSIILLKQYRYALGKYTYELPGGIVDRDEDMAQAAIREAEEETGWRAKKVEHLLTINPDTCLSNQEVAIYLATDLVQTRPRHEETEIIEIVTFGLVRALEMVRDGEITNADSVAGLQATALKLQGI